MLRDVPGRFVLFDALSARTLIEIAPSRLAG